MVRERRAEARSDAGSSPSPGDRARGAEAAVRSHATLFLFWVPLAAQWVMMALEGPFLVAVIARMADPAASLAAFGVAFAFAILVESPVIMLMSASTALVEHRESYRRLRNFANALNAGSTALLLLLLVPPVYWTVTADILNLPGPVAELVYGSLWLLLPWPAAIGYRRFLHGVLIRSGRTRQVAYGTLLRLAGMSSTALLLFIYAGWPGAWVGAAALSAGVCVEALAARVMAVPALRELSSGETAEGADPTHALTGEGAAEAGAASEGVLAAEAAARRTAAAVIRPSEPAAPSYAEITRFYYPLALTSLIGLAVHPMLTFFMGRAASPLESLAVFPVVQTLGFLFRAPGFAFQEVVIALAGRRFEHAAKLARFGAGMAIATSGALALVAFTPLAAIWFEVVSGLPPELAAMAVTPARILAPFPAMAVILAFQHGVLVRARRTRPITLATVLEVVGTAALFTFFGWRLGLFGASAAMLALLGGRLLGNLFLVRPVLAGLAAGRGR